MFNITELSCRVCLEEQDILINIYDELEELQTNLSNLLETCADLQINENDIFPKFLCENCTRELLITSKFREKCVKSKEVLCKILQNTKMVENEESFNTYDVIEYCAEDLNDIEVDDLIVKEEQNIENYPQDVELIEEIVESEKQDYGVSLLKNSQGAEFINEVNSKSVTEEPTSVINNTNQINLATEESAEKEINPTALTLDPSTLIIPSEYINISRPLSEKLRGAYVYKCDICGAIFKQAINLQKHLQKSHDPMNCFICSKCDHWFSLETEFNKHVGNCNYLEAYNDNSLLENKKTKSEKLFTPTLEPENNRKCVYCERDFPTPFALRMHLRTHTGERPFQCKYCTKSFKTQSQLNVHHKRHTGQADFICTICNKTFYEQSNLSVHMRSHTGERPHACTVCNKTFTRVFLLQFHMRTHTGEKPYKCDYCDKNFRQHTDLRSHLTIHTGQRQHKCVSCGKSYIKRSHLVQHMRKHQIQSSGIENAETGQFEDEHYVEEQSTASEDIQNYVKISEMLDGFNEIIECEDVILQTQDFS